MPGVACVNAGPFVDSVRGSSEPAQAAAPSVKFVLRVTSSQVSRS